MEIIKNLYIHIPFCNKICSYCDFSKMVYTQKMSDVYLNKLFLELKKYHYDLDTLYIGGGSPSSLNLVQLEKLLSKLPKVKGEFTVELMPLDITEDLMKLLLKYKVNRISIGIETINTQRQKELNRICDKTIMTSNILLAKKYISNINLDLMYGFRDETIEEVLKEIDYILSLNPNHISIYSLIIEKNTKLFIEKYQGLSDEDLNKMYYKIIEYLEQHNYIHYEISNFSKPNYESKHNLCYWNNKEYLGLGLGASSYINNQRFSFTRSISNYPNIIEKEILDKKDKMIYEMILGLRLIKGVNIQNFYNKYQESIKEVFPIDKLISLGYLEEVDGFIRIKKEYLYVQNSILEYFL